MVLENMKKTTLITKIGLYDWTIMPFGLKNATSTFTRTMSVVFKELGDKFLKKFLLAILIYKVKIGKNIFNTWMLYFSSSKK
jgi:hypothetical protein